MNAIYYHPCGYKHHFRNPEIIGELANLSDDDGKLVYSNIPISETPKDGFCVIEGLEDSPIKTPSKTKK